MPSEVLEYDRIALDLADRYNSVEISQNQSFGPFGSMAVPAASHGFAVIPCGGADDPSGKRPLIKWGNFKSHPGVDVVAGWAARPVFGAANLGIITGLSGVTVVDCDTPGCLFKLYDLFGETPIVVTTPSGGLHLYFRSSGERCGPFRVGDIKGDFKGHGGFVVGPPSGRILAGQQRAYRFLEGDWSLREILPPIRPGVPLGEHGARIIAFRPRSGGTHKDSPQDGQCAEIKRQRTPQRTQVERMPDQPPAGRVVDGARNQSLFAALRREALTVSDEEALVRKAVAINETYDPPLDLAEVRKVAASVWRYKSEGRLLGTGEQAIITRAETFDALRAHPGGADALMLLLRLQFSHGAEPGKRFAIAPKAMERDAMFRKWTVRRYRKAIATLEELGLIRQVRKGGRRKGDPHLYVLD